VCTEVFADGHPVKEGTVDEVNGVAFIVFIKQTSLENLQNLLKV